MPCTGDDDSQVREHLRTWDTNSLTVKRMSFQVRMVLHTWKSGTPHQGQRSYKIKLVNSYIVPKSFSHWISFCIIQQKSK